MYGRWQYEAHLKSDAWRQVTGKLGRLRRGRRCACCGTRRRLESHHWRYPDRAKEQTWWLVRLCSWCHRQRVHRLSLVVFGHRTNGLWLTTPAVVLWGKAGRWFGWGKPPQSFPPASVHHSTTVARGGPWKP